MSAESCKGYKSRRKGGARQYQKKKATKIVRRAAKTMLEDAPKRATKGWA